MVTTTRRRRARKRRMGTILGELGTRECFATDADYLEYQAVLARARALPLSETMDGEQVVPTRNRIGKRTRTRFKQEAVRE